MKSETAYLLAIVVIAVAGIGGIVAIDLIQPASLNVALVEHVMTILTITLPILLGILKSMQNGRAIEEVKETVHEAKAEVQLAVAESARAVADSVAAPGKNGLP